jgi:hypothetical protein
MVMPALAISPAGLVRLTFEFTNESSGTVADPSGA